MEVPGKVPDTINCHACGAVIDLTGQVGFTHVDCPRCGAVSVVPVKFGLFLLLNTLGIGGMGTVYKTIDLSLNRYLALKILRPKLSANPEFIERFTREARSAAAVNHPNVAQVYSFGELEGQHYLAMELLERGSLDDRITREGKLSEKEVLEIGSSVAAGLRAALQRSLLHRDIKPGNILFTQEGAPKIVDFGLARAPTTASEAGNPQLEEQIWGTPYYIAPEKLRGQPDDFRSDMYSLGATLFHALAGRPPFDAETADEVVSKQASQPAFSLKTYAPTVQDYTAHVISRMLAKNPAERYNSYDELVRDLREAQAILRVAESVPALTASTGERVSIGSIVGTVIALAICGAVVWFAWTKRHEWFGLERPDSTTTVAAAGSTASSTTTAAQTAAETEDLAFPEDEPWMKAWNTAALQLAQGRYNEALLGYDNVMNLLGPNRTQHRRWIYYFQGLTLVAIDRPAEAEASLFKAIDPRQEASHVPDKITTGNFVSTLASSMLRGISIEALETAVPRMPPWAVALTRLTVGFKYLDKGDFQKAADAFRQYHKLARDESNRWAFNLQPLAPKLASRCDEAAATLAQIDALQKEQKFGTALESVRAATNTTLTALKAALLARETELDKTLSAERDQMERAAAETERQRQEQGTRDQQLLGADKQVLQALEPSLAALWQDYDFAGTGARYDTLATKITTTEGRHLLQSRQATARLLVEFKQQLSSDFEQRPYAGNDLQTRAGMQLSGRLAHATGKQLAFSTQYGEVLTDWSDLSPQMLIKLAVYYANAFAQAEKPAARAQRYLLLAVFCKQYGLDRSATGYLRQAQQLQPSLPPEAAIIFGSSPG